VLADSRKDRQGSLREWLLLPSVVWLAENWIVKEGMVKTCSWLPQTWVVMA